MAWELPFDERFDEQNDCGGGGKLSRHFSENTTTNERKTVFSHDEFPLARPYSSGYYAVQLLSDLDGKRSSL
jgi:hypothetical protein